MEWIPKYQKSSLDGKSIDLITMFEIQTKTENHSKIPNILHKTTARIILISVTELNRLSVTVLNFKIHQQFLGRPVRKKYLTFLNHSMAFESGLLLTTGIFFTIYGALSRKSDSLY